MEQKKFKTFAELLVEKVEQARTEGRRMPALAERIYDQYMANKANKEE